MCASTVSLNFALAFFFTSATASAASKSCLGSKLAASVRKRLPWNFFAPVFFVVSILILHLDAHRARGSGDDVLGGVDIVGVDIGHLYVRDIFKLLLREFADLIAIRFFRSRFDFQRLL